MEAWVTTLVDDGEVDKVCTLGASLRRVKTGKKLVVQTTCRISSAIKSQLLSIFDLVLPLVEAEGWILEEKDSADLEALSKAHVFTLKFVEKCVYIDRNAVVVNNCDDVFDRYQQLAVGYDEEGEKVDTSIFLVTPRSKYERFVKLLVLKQERGSIPECFLKWWEKCTSDWEAIDEVYNRKAHIGMQEDIDLLVDCGLSTRIVSFVRGHPLDLLDSPTLSPNEKMFADLCRQLLEEQTDGKTKPKELGQNEPIAIVGLSFRLPGANSPDEFWDLLVNGKEAIKPVPDHRWLPEHTSTHNVDRSVEAGFLDCRVDEVDGQFFGWSGAELEFVDPQQRLLHEVVWESLEDAGVNPHLLRGTQDVGVFVGIWRHDYVTICSKVPDRSKLREYLGNSVASASARLSHFLGTTGPSFSFENACSSSVVALHSACASLRGRQCSVAIVSGANLLLEPFDQTTFDVILSKSSRCKTFDASADGYCRSEGVAAVVMKRLSDAVRDGDRIWGMIRGSAVAQEGISGSLSTPTVEVETLAMKEALRDAGVHPKNVSVIEAHGTGTSVGDPIEVAAIAKAYSCPERSEPLLIGSVKTNVGHTESVSGLVGLIKILLAMKKHLLPPHLNLNTLNPEINLDVIPAHIYTSPITWSRTGNKRRLAGVSNFGVTGLEAHLIVEEPPELLPSILECTPRRPLQLMKLSATTSAALDELIQKYKVFLQTLTDKGDFFPDVAFSANTGRADFRHRAVIEAKDTVDALRVLCAKSFKRGEVPHPSTPLCFFFPGEGSQYLGMARELYATSPIFKTNFDKCSSFLEKRYNISIKDVLWENQNEEVLSSRLLYCHTAIFCVEYSLLQTWRSWGVKPDFVLGHGVGEFCAAVAASILTFTEALQFIVERSLIIETGSVESALENFGRNNLEESTYNAAIESYRQVVARILESSTRRLAMKRQARPKYISGLEGRLLDDLKALRNPDYWIRHGKELPRFQEASKVAEHEGCTLFLEVGPSALFKTTNDTSATFLPSLQKNGSDWATMLGSISKLYLSSWKGHIDWKGLHLGYSQKRVDLPKYPFQRKRVWVNSVVEPRNIHPLLGQPYPTPASCGQVIFQNDFTLKKAPFIGDYMIGNSVIFPEAAYLDMCLTAGYLSSLKSATRIPAPNEPIGIQDMTICAPLKLIPSKFVTLQTIVKLGNLQNEDDLDSLVSICRRCDPTESSISGSWMTHVEAKFVSNIFPYNDLQLPPSPQLNIEEIKETWFQEDLSTFYNRLAHIGFNLGPKFISLSKVWKNEKVMLFELVAELATENASSSFIHPLEADAMLQGTLYHRFTSNGDLSLKTPVVPTRIGNFLKIPSTSSPERKYVHTWAGEDDNVHANLVNDLGSVVAYMGSVEFHETTIEKIENQVWRDEALKLWKEVWKPVDDTPEVVEGNCQHISSAIQLNIGDLQELSLLIESEECDNSEKLFISKMRELCGLLILQILFDLNWTPVPGQAFTVDNLIEGLLVLEKYRNYIRHSFDLLVPFNLLDKVDSFSYSLVIPHNDLETILSKSLQYFSNEKSYSHRAEYRKVIETSKELAEVLQGSKSPLSVLFLEDSERTPVTLYYTELIATFRPALRRTLEVLVRKMVENVRHSPVVRVLEVGAGTGTLTTQFLDVCNSLAFPEDDFILEYYFTDVSSTFFAQVSERLASLNRNKAVKVNFKKFNLNEDPVDQGFALDHFDLVLGFDVFHVAKDLRSTLEGIKSVMKPEGGIFLVEDIVLNSSNFFNFGLLDGYWEFEDPEIRSFGPLLSGNGWEDVLRSTGFVGAHCIPVRHSEHGLITGTKLTTKPAEGDGIDEIEEQYSWLILTSENEGPASFVGECLERKLRDVGRNVYTCPKPSRNQLQESFLRKHIYKALSRAQQAGDRLEGVIHLWPLSKCEEEIREEQFLTTFATLTLCQSVAHLQVSPKLIILTQGACEVNECHPLTSLSAAPIVSLVRSIWNEMPNFHLSHFDLAPSVALESSLMDQIFSNLWRAKSRQLAFDEDGQLLTPKLVAVDLEGEKQEVSVGCAEFCMNLSSTNYNDEDMDIPKVERPPLAENEVELKVKAMSLNNIQDVAHREMDGNAPKMGVAGVVTKIGSKVTLWSVGDRVIAICHNTNLSRRTTVKHSLLARLPPSWTVWEGCSIPFAFCTAYHSLVEIGSVKEGTTVLIHNASSAVGLCGIQLCIQFGASVFVSAESKRQRNYLRSLEVQQVLNPKSSDFIHKILEATNGHGVDLVLVSVPESGAVEASLKVLSRRGRLIVTSTLDTWTPEKLKNLRPDVEYFNGSICQISLDGLNRLLGQLDAHLMKGLVKPIPFQRFGALDIRKALENLKNETCNELGAVVYVMPEVRLEYGKLQSWTPLFTPESTYLVVVRDLDEFAFEVVAWILKNGGRHIAVASQQQVTNLASDFTKKLKSFQKQGTSVRAFAIDFRSIDAVRELIEKIFEFPSPPLRGIFICNSDLSVGSGSNGKVLLKQSWSKFETAFRSAMVDCIWNLHNLTKSHYLEYFVSFSSISSIFGPVGQVGHSVANRFGDALIQYRHSQGLPGTSVCGNWGALRIPGVQPTSTAGGLLALESILRSGTRQVGIANLESWNELQRSVPFLKDYIKEKHVLTEETQPAMERTQKISSNQFWENLETVTGKDEKLSVVVKLIECEIVHILHLDDDESVTFDPELDFQTQGVDSLAMIELRNQLEKQLRSRVTLTDAIMKSCSSPLLLGVRLLEMISIN